MKLHKILITFSILSFALSGCNMLDYLNKEDSKKTTEVQKNKTEIQIPPITEKDAINLFRDSYLLQYDILNPDGNKQITKINGKEYYKLDEKYDTKEKLLNALSNVYTKEKTDSFIEEYGIYVDQKGNTYRLNLNAETHILPEGHSASFVKGNDTVKEFNFKMAVGNPTDPDYEKATIIYEYIKNKGWRISDILMK